MNEYSVKECLRLSALHAESGDYQGSICFSLMGILGSFVQDRQADAQRNALLSLVAAAEGFFEYPSDDGFQNCLDALNSVRATS